MCHSSHITFQAFLIAGIVLTVSCGNKPPTQPSPNPLLLSCPAATTLEATTALGTVAIFDPPSITGGSEPYSTQCMPASGSLFLIGETTVTCTGTDADRQQASCSFRVNVRVSRALNRTRFVAFGDSITAGEVSDAALRLFRLPFEDYPFKLEEMLRARYPTQGITITNWGFGGERLDQGVKRLPSVLDADRSEVLLLLEGVNNVRNTPTATAAGHLRTMISTARDRGVEVIIATVMPISAAREAGSQGTMAAIQRLNAQIVLLAAEYGLGSPVDLFGLFQAEPHLLGIDGLHPTAQGYTRIAETFRAAILDRYERRAAAATLHPEQHP